MVAMNKLIGFDLEELIARVETESALPARIELGNELDRRIGNLQRDLAHLQGRATVLQADNTRLVLENRALRGHLDAGLRSWVDDVLLETAKAIRKHGLNDYTDFQRMCILAEEVGEVANILCRTSVPPIGAGVNPERERVNLRAELIQVASVAVRWVEKLDQRPVLEHEEDQ